MFLSSATNFLVACERARQGLRGPRGKTGRYDQKHFKTGLTMCWKISALGLALVHGVSRFHRQAMQRLGLLGVWRVDTGVLEESSAVALPLMDLRTLQSHDFELGPVQEFERWFRLALDAGGPGAGVVLLCSPRSKRRHGLGSSIESF